MKRCPYCAEEIQDAAIFCRYCRMDLPDAHSEEEATHKINFEMDVKIDPENMRASDLSDLMEAWADSYENAPTSLRAKWNDAVDPITGGWLLNIVEEWVRHKMGSQYEIERNILTINANCIIWATVTSAIGIEAGKEQIPENDVPYYLIACNIAIGSYLLALVEFLLEKGWIRKEQADRLNAELQDILKNKSILLANWGIFSHTENREKYSNGEVSPMARALQRIDIEKLKR